MSASLLNGSHRLQVADLFFLGQLGLAVVPECLLAAAAQASAR